MLSKEEISKLKINIFNQCDDETIRLVAEMLKHKEQLESDKQKLIEKLEEIIKETSQNINPEAMKKYQNLKMEEINDETYILLAMHRIGFAGEILEIVKGENQVTVK